MKNWQTDLLSISESHRNNEHEIFRVILLTAKRLGWEYCAYGLRMPLPMSDPKILMMNNYSPTWNSHYQSSGYLNVDPTVIHGRSSQKPIIWDDPFFCNAPELWADARNHGLRIGWAQSSLDSNV